MRLAATFAATCALALTATAPLADDFTLSERSDLHAEIRAYLLENPEVLMEAMEVLEERRAIAAAATDQQLVAQYAQLLFDDPSSWSGGNPDGDIRLVEFIDYKCGYCKRAHPEVSELIESDGNIRIIRKEFPILGAESMLGARYALAVRMVAGDDSYALASDTLMGLRGAIDVPALEELSTTLGLDWGAIEPAMASDEVTEILRANHTLAQQLQINGTPAFVLESEMLRGYVPLDAMRAIVAQQRDQG